ncbi:MAG: hypothetical protein IJ333_00165 [Clostridia bacterium]|nr:hypothetical protein [Clostridia bacterium]
MKRFFALLTALLLLLSLSGCKAEREDLQFYVLKEADIPQNAGNDALLQAAKSNGRLVFTGEDVAGWLWAEHTVRLKNVNVKGSAKDGGSVLFQTKAEDLFLLTLGDRVLYSGGFEVGSEGIYIQDAGDLDFKIGFQNAYGDLSDPRGSTVLYDFLIEHRLLVSELKEEQ